MAGAPPGWRVPRVGTPHPLSAGETQAALESPGGHRFLHTRRVAWSRLCQRCRVNSANRGERILAFDERTGQRQWVYAYDPDYPKWALDGTNPLGPRATPIVENGRLYSLGILGHLVALDAKTGAVLWKHDIQKEFAGDPECTGSPLIENDLLIVSVGARPDACVIAFDKESGKKVWSASTKRRLSVPR